MFFENFCDAKLIKILKKHKNFGTLLHPYFEASEFCIIFILFGPIIVNRLFLVNFFISLMIIKRG